MEALFFLFAALSVFCLVMIGYAIALGSTFGTIAAIFGVCVCMGIGFYLKAKGKNKNA